MHEKIIIVNTIIYVWMYCGNQTFIHRSVVWEFCLGANVSWTIKYKSGNSGGQLLSGAPPSPKTTALTHFFKITQKPRRLPKFYDIHRKQ